MFTGLIEEIGTIDSIKKSAKSATISIVAKKVLEDVKIGDSISMSGICLTVTHFVKGRFSVDVMAETIKRTYFDHLQIGDRVNLERALRVGDRLGGHMVSGHIDGTGTILGCTEEGNAVWFSIGAPAEVLRYVMKKGSIAIDGISLTVANVTESSFSVSIIPHTMEETALHRKKPGNLVNLECDMVGKYIEKFITYDTVQDPKKKIDINFLHENGFL